MKQSRTAETQEKGTTLLVGGGGGGGGGQSIWIWQSSEERARRGVTRQRHHLEAFVLAELALKGRVVQGEGG